MVQQFDYRLVILSDEKKMDEYQSIFLIITDNTLTNLKKKILLTCFQTSLQYSFSKTLHFKSYTDITFVLTVSVFCVLQVWTSFTPNLTVLSYG